MNQIEPTFCQACHAFCPIEATIENGKLVKVTGNRSGPLYEGYTCPKGRALPQVHNSPTRLMSSLKRQPGGNFQSIATAQAINEIVDKLRAIIKESGPRAVASFLSAPVIPQPATAPVLMGFMKALGSPMNFSTVTIDQPGILLADALHGSWEGGRPQLESCDVFMVIGTNPIASKQWLVSNPGLQLKKMLKNGTQLIVIDPRRTDVARKAHIHLQPIPGEDPSVLAGLIHLVIANGDIDEAFIGENTLGFEAIKAAVSRFTPDYVSRRADIDEAQLLESARVLGRAKSKRGEIAHGTGPSMSTKGVLTAYLAVCLQTLLGFWPRAGESASKPNVLLPRRIFKAQPRPPYPAWGFGEKFRTRGYHQSVAGLPTGALAEEILEPGEGQIRAVFCLGGLLKACPEEKLIKRALENLELLVVQDIELTGTAQLADYVIATHMPLETPIMSQIMESAKFIHHGYGWYKPFAAYSPALVEPPAGADLIEDWRFFYRIAQKMKLQLECSGFFGPSGEGAKIDMENEPTTDEVFELMCRGSRIPLSEVKKFPQGHIFEDAREVVQPRDPDCAARLELGNQTMLGQLNEVRDQDYEKQRSTDSAWPFLLIPRRYQNSQNSSMQNISGVRKTSYNPAYMNPADLSRLQLTSGDKVIIRSKHGEIVAFVEMEEGLRQGVVSMTHGYGANPQEVDDPYAKGVNVNRLLKMDDDVDPHTGQPRMGAVPVKVLAA